jgi:hypothetical protein
MLDAATEADRERMVEQWAAPTGTATWDDDNTRSDTTYTAETYILTPDYSLDEYRQAINLALRQSKRTYRYVLPLTPNIDAYHLTGMTWLEGAGDIADVAYSSSPNMLHNEDFEFWQQGSALAPDGWTLAGSGATVARAAGFRSPYAATVTRASADATLYQETPLSLLHYLVRSTSAPLPLVSAGAWVTSATADIARIGVYNGSTTTWSTYHTGSGVPQFLEASYQTAATDTALRLVLSVDTTNGAGTFNFAGLVQQPAFPDLLRDRGSKAYDESPAWHTLQNTGSVPAIGLYQYRAGQLVVTSRRGFAELSLDTDVVEDQYADTILAGALRFLTDAVPPNVPRERYDRVRGEEAAKWTRALEKNTSNPVAQPISRVSVGGV